jgi:hypothetical protein
MQAYTITESQFAYLGAKDGGPGDKELHSSHHILQDLLGTMLAGSEYTFKAHRERACKTVDADMIPGKKVPCPNSAIPNNPYLHVS